MINIFVITRKEFFLIATVIILYINLDVLLQIIVGEKKMSLINENYLKLQDSYLFSTIAKKVNEPIRIPVRP